MPNFINDVVVRYFKQLYLAATTWYLFRATRMLFKLFATSFQWTRNAEKALTGEAKNPLITSTVKYVLQALDK